MIGDALVASNASHVRQTRALAAVSIAMLHGAVGAQNAAIALATILCQCIAEETVATVFAVVARRFVQTAQALTCMQIAIAALPQIDVVAAVAFLALVLGQLGIAEVVVSTNVAPRSGVSFATVAHHIVGTWIQDALVGVRVV